HVGLADLRLGGGDGGRGPVPDRRRRPEGNGRAPRGTGSLTGGELGGRPPGGGGGVGRLLLGDQGGELALDRVEQRLLAGHGLVQGVAIGGQLVVGSLGVLLVLLQLRAQGLEVLTGGLEVVEGLALVGGRRL